MEVQVKKKQQLPLCPYGARCYRKNPAHFREYLHDFAAADSEDGEDGKGSEGSEDEAAGKPECPYGARCYRKNPAHLKEYSHPAKGIRREEKKSSHSLNHVPACNNGCCTEVKVILL